MPDNKPTAKIENYENMFSEYCKSQREANRCASDECDGCPITAARKRMCNDERVAYEKFKLQWMQDHNLTITDLIASVIKFAEEIKDDQDGPVSPEDIIRMWEADVGFNGMIWPCFDEWYDCEFKW